MFDPREDPLALGLKQRAREQRMAGWAQNPSLAALEPALGEDWDAFFQATDEAADGLPVKFAGGAAPSSPVDPNADAGALFAAHSNQLRGIPASIAALRTLKKR